MKPILDRVIIKQDARKEKIGSLIVPDGAKVESPRGEVLAVGSNVKELKAGDYVLFNVNNHQKFFSNQEEYVTLNEADILAILDKDDEVKQTKMADDVGIQVSGEKYA